MDLEAINAFAMPIPRALTPEELEAGPIEPGVYTISDEDYHGVAPGISSTGVKRLLKSPAHYLRSEPLDSDALTRGRRVHEALLQPERFAARYVAEPVELHLQDKRRNPGKKDWDAFKEAAEAAGKEIIPWEDSQRIGAIVKRLCFDSPVWRRMTTGAHYELAAFAEVVTGTSGVPVLAKAKADVITPEWILDVKTCQDASVEACVRAITDYGYHVSAAYYLDVFEAALGFRVPTFAWCFVEWRAPHAVRWIAASESMLELGRKQYRRALAVYAHCVATGEWPDYPEEFTDVELPEWYTRKFLDM